MAKTFLERHKKKSVVGFLLFLIRGGKGLGPLLLLVAFLSFLFIVPTSSALRFPWVSKLERLLGLATFLGRPGAFRLVSLEEALREARADHSSGWGSWLGGSRFLSNYGKSSVDMVRAGKMSRDGMPAWGSEDGIGARAAREAGAKSISGIMNPDDAKLSQEGVPVDQNELVRGLLTNADAGMFTQGAGNPGFGGQMNGVNGGRGVNGSNILNGPGAASPDGGILNTSYGPGGVPGAGGGRIAGLGKGGKISGYKWAKISANINAGLKNPLFAGSKTDMYQLAVTNAYSLSAALPMVSNTFGSGQCPEGNCPREFASNTGGVPFNGGHTVDGILAALALNDPVPILPGQQMQTLVNQAKTTEQQAKQCEDAQAVYGPQEQQWMNTIQADGNALSAKCSGGCNSACPGLISKMRADCNQYNNVVQQHYAACPLMQQNGQGPTTMNCSQSAGAENDVQTYIANPTQAVYNSMVNKYQGLMQQLKTN